MKKSKDRKEEGVHQYVILLIEEENIFEKAIF